MVLTFHVPNPNCGIFWPLLNVMYGACDVILLFWKNTECQNMQNLNKICELCARQVQNGLNSVFTVCYMSTMNAQKCQYLY